VDAEERETVLRGQLRFGCGRRPVVQAALLLSEPNRSPCGAGSGTAGSFHPVAEARLLTGQIPSRLLVIRVPFYCRFEPIAK
jgi:hypothetical protein